MDGVVDEHLADGGGEGEEAGEEEEGGVLDAVGNARPEGTLGEQRAEADDERRGVVVEHLVVGGALVGDEQALLQRGGEAVGEEEDQQQHDAVHRVGRVRLLVGFRAREDEHGAAQHDPERERPVAQAVGLGAQHRADDEDGEHLGRLGEGLRRERDVLERLVLAERPDGVGEGDRKVVRHVGLRRQGLFRAQQADQRHDDGDDPVVGNQKLGSELAHQAIAKGSCHQSFLEDSIEKEANHQPRPTIKSFGSNSFITTI